jgi:hypothetical protein
VSAQIDELNGLSIDNTIADVAVYSDKARYHALFAQLRRDDPVRWTTPDAYRPFWTVSKHADISEVQRKSTLYISGPRTTLNTIEAETKIRAVTGRKQSQRSIISTDGAEHTVMRAVTADWSLPDSVRPAPPRRAVFSRSCKIPKKWRSCGSARLPRPVPGESGNSGALQGIDRTCG